MKMKHTMRMTAAALAAAALVSAAAPLAAQAAPAYKSKWTQTYTTQDLMAEALGNQRTDAAGVYQQFRDAFRFKTLSEMEFIALCNQQALKIPAQAATLLYKDGYISAYTYKTVTHQAYAPEDFAGVFDADFYFAANPDLQATIGHDKNALFQDFLANGMNLGRRASAEFDLTAFKANYPDLVKAYGANNAIYYLHYLIYKRTLPYNAQFRIGK